MSGQAEGAVSPGPPERRLSISSVEAGQDTTPDKFEDAVDAGSVRSLTKRSISTPKPASPEHENNNNTAVEPESKHSSNGAGHTSNDRQDSPQPEAEVGPPSQRTSSLSMSKRISGPGNLDNVNLDDDMPVHAEEPKSPETKDQQPSKTLSLNSITSALPAMPWSPSPESPPKSPNPPSAAVAAPPPPPPQSSQAPPPPTRKLTSPFSWLSRSASKDKETAPTLVSPRRNTASSIATLTSNPEMMLSRLDEENNTRTDGQGRPARGSLKDRFKLLRMREEAGITSPFDDEKTNNPDSGVPAGSADDSTERELPPVPGPDISLAPGTVSGVNAGPSAMPGSEVDWDLWQSVVYEGPAAVAHTSADELNKAIATGIPSAIRGVVWQVLAQSKNGALESIYRDLVAKGTEVDKARHSNSTSASSGSQTNLGTGGDTVASSASSVHSNISGSNAQAGTLPDKVSDASAKSPFSEEQRKRREKEDAAKLQKLEKTIRRDLGARTSFSKYAAAQGLQESLFGVCKAYALYDEDVGYAQGMNFLIMPLLFHMPEEEAFSMLVRLMHHYCLRDLFVQDMPGLHMHLYQFERLLEDLEPALFCHLHRRGISPHLYATQWFLTLFAYRFPLQLVLRIYDLILSDGLSAILRFGIVLMQKNATTLLGISDMQQLTVYLKDKLFDVYIDKDPSQGSILESGFFGSSSSNFDKEVYRADQLVRDACEVKITPELLKAYTSEWEEKSKAEKDRETELHELRKSNQQLIFQVRKLEERVEVCDHEQAALATELVHTKVENQELKDENEGLKGQVRELRVVIEKQPLEIEGTWKLERDDLMKRNQKVHEENQELESSLQDLEEQLVETKMRYAEINSQHETLNRKWSELKRQFA